MKTTLLLFLIFVGMGFSNNLFAQQPDSCNINPGFFYSDTSNCEIYFYPSNYDATYDYSWDFGDGSYSNQAFVNHQYANSGVYDVIIDQFRSSKNYKSLFEHTESESFLDFEFNSKEHNTSMDTVLDAFAQEEIEEILNQLPPASRITFNLFAIEGYSYKEIAEELDIGYESVKWHIKESRKKLRSILKLNTLELE
nr:sigma-70 family RNA polymerase sigma factor [uncultured Brumimicrobium sp.]